MRNYQLIIMAVLILAGTALGVDKAANFSGTWVRDTARSDSWQSPHDGGITDMIPGMAGGMSRGGTAPNRGPRESGIPREDSGSSGSLDESAGEWMEGLTLLIAQADNEFQMTRQLFTVDGNEKTITQKFALDGTDSPVTQTFGLGLFENLCPATLDEIECFFFDRGAPVFHEVSPMAGVAALDLLCSRNYRPIEISNVLYQRIEKPPEKSNGPIRVHVAESDEMKLWTDISTRGWTSDHPELLEFFEQFSKLSSARRHSVYFLAEFKGKPGAAALLHPHAGVALLGGAATISDLRHRGLQSALLRERMRYAFEHGCDVVSMAAEAGSESQRNAERNGFRIAYTRTKWLLAFTPSNTNPANR